MHREICVLLGENIKMSDFINSPIFIAVLTCILTIIGTLLKGLWTALGKADERLKALEISTNDIDGVKGSIANLGARLGSSEAKNAVFDQIVSQLHDALQDIRSAEKENNEAFTSILASINEVKTDLSVIKFRLDSQDRKGSA